MKKKKVLSAALAAVVACGSVAVVASARFGDPEIEENGLTYWVEEDGCVVLHKIDSSLVEVTIPETVQGKPFVIDNGLSGGENLQKINVSPDNKDYTSVDGVLFNKDKTTLIKYPRGKKDTSYIIPDGVTVICNRAFHDCDALKSVKIPDSVDTLGSYAFYGCEQLKDVTLPGGLKPFENPFDRDFIESIAFNGDLDYDDAFRFFYGFSSLKEVTLRRGATYVRFLNLFENCPLLTSFNVDADNDNYSSVDGVLYDKNQTMLVRYPEGKGSSYVIPDGVTCIGEGAFAVNHTLESVTIPESVTQIDDHAFYTCPSLDTIIYKGTKEQWDDISFGDHWCYDGEARDFAEYKVVFDNSKPADETKPAAPGDTEQKQEILEVTLKNVDSENGIEGEALDKLLFGDSGWTWEQVDRIVFTSDKLFSVRYKNNSGDWVTLNDKPAIKADEANIWSTLWVLDASVMGKDKIAKVIAKDGTADITAKIYIKKGAEKPSGSDNKPTGIALAIAPVVLAAGAVIVISKKRSK